MPSDRRAIPGPPAPWGPWDLRGPRVHLATSVLRGSGAKPVRPVRRDHPEIVVCRDCEVIRVRKACREALVLKVCRAIQVTEVRREIQVPRVRREIRVPKDPPGTRGAPSSQVRRSRRRRAH